MSGRRRRSVTDAVYGPSDAQRAANASVGSQTPSPAFQRRVADEAHQIEARKRREAADAAAADALARVREAGSLPSVSKGQHFTPYQREQARKFRGRALNRTARRGTGLG